MCNHTYGIIIPNKDTPYTTRLCTVSVFSLHANIRRLHALINWEPASMSPSHNFLYTVFIFLEIRISVSLLLGYYIDFILYFISLVRHSMVFSDTVHHVGHAQWPWFILVVLQSWATYTTYTQQILILVISTQISSLIGKFRKIHHKYIECSVTKNMGTVVVRNT